MKEYITLGKKFGDLVVAGDFDKAYEFFSPDLKDSVSKEDLISSYHEMVEYFSDEGPCSISAEDPSVTTDLGDGLVLVYVPIESNNEFDEAEALSLTFDRSNKIIEIEFGRP